MFVCLSDKGVLVRGCGGGPSPPLPREGDTDSCLSLFTDARLSPQGKLVRQEASHVPKEFLVT